MIVCIDCFKLFQTISNKNKTCNGAGSQSESENRTWHHAQTSRRKYVIYILFERIIKRRNLPNQERHWISCEHEMPNYSITYLKLCVLNSYTKILLFLSHEIYTLPSSYYSLSMQNPENWYGWCEIRSGEGDSTYYVSFIHTNMLQFCYDSTVFLAI